MSDQTISFNSSRFGELSVPASSVMRFPTGVIGFPGAYEYVLLEYNPPFSWLQSVDAPDLAFVVVSGAEFGEHYSFSLPVGDRDIDLQQEDDVAIINIVSVRPDPSMTTVNLKAPVVVNLRTMRGKQIVLDDARFPTRFPLYSPAESDSEKPK